MRVLTKNLSFIVLLILAVGIIRTYPQIATFVKNKIDQYVYISVCERPVQYKLGSIDPRFNLSEDKFLKEINLAVQIWNEAEEKKLFLFDKADEHSLTINLVFDKRQQLSNQITNLQNQLDQKNQVLKPQIQQYEQRVTDFKKRVTELNSQIESWNSKGGAPPDEYEKLIAEQNNLKVEAEQLNQMARDLNLSTKNYNADVSQLNQTINTFDEALQKKPEEGLFDPNKGNIDIYFNNDRNELIHTLAHEFGHSIGLSHNQNSKSIMYAYSTKIIKLSREDIDDLNRICAQRFLNLPFSLKLLPNTLSKFLN